jgi:alkaline phosphatase D
MNVECRSSIRALVFHRCSHGPCVQWSETLVPDLASPDTRPLRRIAFGSCARAHIRPQRLWSRILAAQPDLWVWTGDAVYADHREKGRFVPATLSDIAQAYAAQLRDPDYALLRTRVPHTGVWDDHDMGWNDAGRDYPWRDGSQFLFLRFLGEAESSPRWQRRGLYGSFLRGPPGRQLHFVLLDTRSFRDPIAHVESSGDNLSGRDVLGEEQWAWLAKDLQRAHGALVHVIVSSIQVCFSLDGCACHLLVTDAVPCRCFRRRCTTQRGGSGSRLLGGCCFGCCVSMRAGE